MDSFFFFFFSSLLSLTAPLSHHQVRHLFTSKLTLTLCEGGRKDTGFSAVSAFSRTHTSPQNPNSPLGAGQPNKQTAIRSVAGQLLCLLSLHPHQQPPAPRRPAPKGPPAPGDGSACHGSWWPSCGHRTNCCVYTTSRRGKMASCKSFKRSSNSTGLDPRSQASKPHSPLIPFTAVTAPAAHGAGWALGGDRPCPWATRTQGMTKLAQLPFPSQKGSEFAPSVCSHLAFLRLHSSFCF